MALGLVLNRSRQVPAEDSPAFGAIAERFRRAGDLERAVSLCQEGLQRFPTHVSARVTLGWSLLDLGRYEEARAELEQALKRAPDNLAAIRGLAELHDRSEHDEVAAMHRSGAKWMSEVAASGNPVEAEAPHASPIASAPTVMAPASLAAADPLAIRPAATVAGGADIAKSLDALKAFATGAVVAPVAQPAPMPVALPASPWQPVEIETAAAHVLNSTASSAVVVSPVVATPASDVTMPEETDFSHSTEPELAHVADDVRSMDDFDAPLPAPDAFAASELALMTPAVRSADDTHANHVDPMVVAAVEAAEPSHVVKPLVLTPVVAMPATESDLIVDEFDPDLPALASEWSEMVPDAFLLPAAVEAARATADEGPGPWPPVIADDPVETPAASLASVTAMPTPARRPNVHALNRFLRGVETRRANVVAQYLAG